MLEREREIWKKTFSVLFQVQYYGFQVRSSSLKKDEKGKLFFQSEIHHFIVDPGSWGILDTEVEVFPSRKPGSCRSMCNFLWITTSVVLKPTYPTLEKGKSSSKTAVMGEYLNMKMFSNLTKVVFLCYSMFFSHNWHIYHQIKMMFPLWRW